MTLTHRHGLLILVATLMLVIYPLPNIIALRNVLLICALALSMPVMRASLLDALKSRFAFRTLVSVLLLYIWMILVAVFIDPFPSLSLREFLGQWVTALAAFIVGICIAKPIKPRSPTQEEIIAALIFTTCMVHVLGHNLSSLWFGFKHNVLPTHYVGLSDHPANIGYVITLLVPVLAADLVSRMVLGTRILPWKVWVNYLSFAICAIALLFAGARNSQIVFLMLVAITSATLWWSANRSMAVVARVVRLTALACAIGIFATTAYKLDGRWSRVAESIEIGWDTDSYKGWIYSDGREIPSLKNGEEIEASTYLRVAYLKEGLRALQGHLLGTEINKNAFKNLVMAEYGTAGMCCAHNGLVDLGISAGVPAMILWCAFLYFLFKAGRDSYKNGGNVLGYALMLLVIGFGTRMFFDSTLRDHIILQFMLCAGLLLGTCVRSPETVQAVKAAQ